MSINVTLRSGTSADAETCGTICFEAFKTISDEHNFPRDFPSPEAAIGLLSFMFPRTDIYSVVAEVEGRIAGSNFLWEDELIAGVGPITVDPTMQNSAVGRRLMEEVLRRASERGFAGVRLLQAAYHNRSLSLYTKLGFDTREPISLIQGKPPKFAIATFAVRSATEHDIDDCNRLYSKVHGHTRTIELTAAIRGGLASVVESEGRLIGYSTGVGFLGHSVGESNEAIKALIGAANEFSGPGFLLPTRNGELLRWCLAQGLRIVMPMTLMSTGLYNEPKGAFLPSVIY